MPRHKYHRDRVYQLVRNPPPRRGQACSQEEEASLLTSLSHQSSPSEEG